MARNETKSAPRLRLKRIVVAGVFLGYVIVVESKAEAKAA
jgi:hypothetical protein